MDVDYHVGRPHTRDPDRRNTYRYENHMYIHIYYNIYRYGTVGERLFPPMNRGTRQIGPVQNEFLRNKANLREHL
jgi:hypothetical protein